MYTHITTHMYKMEMGCTDKHFLQLKTPPNLSILSINFQKQIFYHV
jgi:hypothetical protein